MRQLIPLLLAAAAPCAEIGPLPNLAAARPQRDLTAAVAGMASDPATRALFAARGLDVLSLTWEDTARTKQSCWGPNISDLTIQVLGGAGGDRGCMPVVRYPNFADRSCDVPLDDLKLLVGNERGGSLTRIGLREYLERFASYQTAATGWLDGALLAPRDHVVLASAQACFLPIPAGGAATFAPVLFNYESSPGAPAVLVILATPEGTSAQVVTNGGEAASGVWHGQRLFHNRAGERAPLRATRFSDTVGADAPRDGRTPAAQRDGLSLVMVIQIPLRVNRPQPVYAAEEDALDAPPAPACRRAAGAAGVDTAVVASGPVEGPWLGLAGCRIARDERFPIRATVQFYQATDIERPTEADAARIARAIDRVYLDAQAVGSLVVDGFTGRQTEPAPSAGPQPWWREPCEAYASRWHEPWADALARVRARLGADWQPADARELRNALELARP